MMQRVVRISQSDYRDILRFQDDGGSAVDIVYEVFPDPVQTPSEDGPKNGGGKLGRAASGGQLN